MLKEEGINEVLKKVKETDVTAFQRYPFHRGSIRGTRNKHEEA